MSVTVENIAVALGRPTPTGEKAAQWTYWIGQALRIIERRATRLGVSMDDLDPEDVDSVVVRAVAAMVTNPDNATQVTISVDDGSTSRTYKSGTGEVSLLDAWWDELGLLEASGTEAFSIFTAGHATTWF